MGPGAHPNNTKVFLSDDRTRLSLYLLKTSPASWIVAWTEWGCDPGRPWNTFETNPRFPVEMLVPLEYGGR